MVKLSGPCFSLEAHGSIANALTFVKTGKTAYGKRHFKPYNPRSDAQSGIRCMTKFLTDDWGYHTDEEQAKFEDLAVALETSPYHAWLTLNSRRWANHLMPILDPSSSVELNTTFASTNIEKTGRLHNIFSMVIDVNSINATVEYCMSKPPGFTAKRSDARVIVPLTFTDGSSMIFGCDWIAPDDDPYFIEARYGIPSGIASPFHTGVYT